MGNNPVQRPRTNSIFRVVRDPAGARGAVGQADQRDGDYTDGWEADEPRRGGGGGPPVLLLVSIDGIAVFYPISASRSRKAFV